MNAIKVGLIGFGNIGAGVVRLLQDNAATIRQKVGRDIILKKIADLDITGDRGVTVADTSGRWRPVRVGLAAEVGRWVKSPRCAPL